MRLRWKKRRFLKWKENRRDSVRIAGFQHPQHLSTLPSAESFFCSLVMDLVRTGDADDQPDDGSEE